MQKKPRLHPTSALADGMPKSSRRRRGRACAHVGAVSAGGWITKATRRGFTLFEIAISLVLVTFGVVSVLMLIPSGLKQLTAQRFRIYAACIANQLVDVYGNADPSSAFCDQEGPGPWDVPIDRRTNAPDLEMRCSNQRFGLLPIPLEIARRIDSDGDEIKQLLDAGGYLYYVQPNVPNAWREDLLPVEPPNDLQKLVVAVVGDAQHNAAFSFPMKRWPYYGTVPAPPLHAIHNRDLGWDPAAPTAAASPGAMVRFEDGAMPAAWKANHATYCWQASVDPDPSLQEVFNAFWDYETWGGPGKPIPTTLQEEETDPRFTGLSPRYDVRAKLGRYIQSTLRYAAVAGLSAGDVQGLLDTPPLAAYAFDSEDANRAARKILAVGYVAHALMCLTRWHKLDVASGADPSLTTGVDLAAVYRIAPALALTPITHDRIVNLMRNARYWYLRFTAGHPYNWAVPRPVEHASMMDYPLLELDLFRPPAQGATWGIAGAAAQQWKYLSPTAITTVTGDPGAPFGASLTYPLGRIPGPDPTSPGAVFSENGPAAGAVTHATLLNQFDPSERCRQLAFWVVDWQSYEDFETAPSAPVDASRYPKAAPGGYKPANPGADGRGWDAAVTPCTSFDDLMWGFTDGWGDATGLEQTTRVNGNAIQLHRALVGSYLHAFRNPEKNLMFSSSVAAVPTGGDVSMRKLRDVVANADVLDWRARQALNSPPDYGPPTAAASPKPPEVFCGRFGADRNGNDRLDRGPVPGSVRLRAIGVARFNYYDLRVPGQIK
jgi:hypothetical protein